MNNTRPPTWAEGLSVKDKPREWWICQTEGFDGDAYDTDPSTWNPPKVLPHDIRRRKFHVVERKALDKANAKIAALTLAYNGLESVHFKEIDRLTKELAEEKQLRLSRERWVERVSEERDRYRSMASKLAESLERWISATDINRNNSDVKNYEEFALECMDAFDNCRAQLQQWRDLEKGEM